MHLGFTFRLLTPCHTLNCHKSHKLSRAAYHRTVFTVCTSPRHPSGAPCPPALAHRQSAGEGPALSPAFPPLSSLPLAPRHPPGCPARGAAAAISSSSSAPRPAAAMASGWAPPPRSRAPGRHFAAAARRHGNGKGREGGGALGTSGRAPQRRHRDEAGPGVSGFLLTPPEMSSLPKPPLLLHSGIVTSPCGSPLKRCGSHSSNCMRKGASFITNGLYKV